MKVVRAKLKGREPEREYAQKPHDAQVVDLMERLKQSLAARRGGQRRTVRPRRAARRIRAA